MNAIYILMFSILFIGTPKIALSDDEKFIADIQDFAESQLVKPGKEVLDNSGLGLDSEQSKDFVKKILSKKDREKAFQRYKKAFRESHTEVIIENGKVQSITGLGLTKNQAMALADKLSDREDFDELLKNMKKVLIVAMSKAKVEYGEKAVVGMGLAHDRAISFILEKFNLGKLESEEMSEKALVKIVGNREQIIDLTDRIIENLNKITKEYTNIRAQLEDPSYDLEIARREIARLHHDATNLLDNLIKTSYKKTKSLKDRMESNGNGAK